VIHLTDFLTLLPELILALGAMVALLVGAFCGPRATRVLSAFLVALMAAALAAVLTGGDAAAFGGAFVTDGFTRFVKVLVLAAAALCIVTADDFFAREKRLAFEYPVLIALATLGMLVMVSAADFLTLYLGLELQSLSLYVLAAFDRSHRRSAEAGLKYFVLGALASGLMLYGISLVYGYAGATGYAAVAGALKASGVSIGLIFGLVFIIAGLAFKISAVPFHMWAPDVYEGAPTPVVAFFATAAKVAAMAMVVRAMLVPFAGALHEWQQVIVAVSVLSMALGAIAGVGQKNIKRLMAYSSIGHMGYALLGLAAGTVLGVQGVLIYLFFYAVSNVGAFVCIQAMRRGGKKVEAISDLAGLSRTHPKTAFAFAALLFSLAGLPPLMGIFAKVYVFLAAIAAHLYIAAVLGVVASCIAAYYYINVVKTMYLDEPADAPLELAMSGGLKAILWGAALISILFVFLPGPLVAAAGAAAGALFP
jgi:NADH-quinone oxidoreductase subunit N